MKANELMVGDWVLWEGEPCIVDVPLLTTEFGGKEFEDSKYMEPISLTQEIIENAFGGIKFEGKESYDYLLVADSSLVIVTIKNDGEMRLWARDRCIGHSKEISINNIQYVHQLQNALRACGIEMEFEL